MDLAELSRQIEYKVAPAPLIAVQGLSNTFAFEPGEERLLDPASACQWLLESDLATPAIRVTRPQWERLVEFREVIRDLIEANRTGDADQKSIARFDRFVGEHPVELTAGEGGALSLDLAPQSSVDRVIAQMIGIVFQAQVESLWPRLKTCVSDDCRWSFFDSSRNRTGTWCLMETCGNRDKNRAYRRRRTGRRAAKSRGG
jgi:predicted RNA-binding Zn ribbon-like protein